jgi:hypothetical protein
MKNFYSAIFLNKVWIVALVVAMAACSQFEAIDPDKATLEQSSEEMAAAFGLEEMISDLSNASIKVTGRESTPVSSQKITPYIIAGANPGGNRTCEEVAAATSGLDGFSNSSGKLDYEEGKFWEVYDKVNPENNVEGSWPEGFKITVTNGTFVSWTFTPPAGKCLDAIAFIVKGSADANVYVYGPDLYNDAGLASPVNASGGSAGLSNLTICYTLRDCDDQKCFDGETAWAAGTRYVTRGNWATYSSKSALEAGVTLFAGQTMPAGTVKLASGVITITLNTGWRFASTNENVKIQHYANKPAASNPAPGLFATKGTATSSPYSIPVSDGKFYGVHVDVEREVVCPR